MMGHKNPLYWGLTLIQLQSEFPKRDIRSIREKTLGIDGVVLQCFEGDCGALLITSANRMTPELAKDVVRLASICGFSKLFATVVGSLEYESIQNAVKGFKKARFKLVAQGKSNRNPYKDDFVFVKYIRKCKYQGY